MPGPVQMLKEKAVRDTKDLVSHMSHTFLLGNCRGRKGVGKLEEGKGLLHGKYLASVAPSPGIYAGLTKG